MMLTVRRRKQQSRWYYRYHAAALCACLMSLTVRADEARIIKFEDATDQLDIQFRHHSPFTPQRHTHLTMGSGVGWIDFDHDGRPDLYCCQGNAFKGADEAERTSVRDELLRNHPSGVFVPAPLLGTYEYSMGVTIGDFDNDGFDDLYVTCFGPDQLLRNNGDGTFEQRSIESPDARSQFGAGCTWIDADSDGNLDLFVVNYLTFDPDNYQICQATYLGTTIYVTCHPRRVPPAADVFYRNLGDSRFADQSAVSELHSAAAKQGLGVVAADLDRDGDTDLYVANDSVENQLWSNSGKGTFTEEGALSGVALNRMAQREAGMGIAVADIDANGLLDLFVTNFFAETNTLYRNEGSLFFLDVTDECGLAEPGRLRLGFGTVFLDADNDGWPDLFVANGHVYDRMEEIGRPEPFGQKALLLKNVEGKQFVDNSNRSGQYFTEPVVGRGCAVADYDRDGRPDLAVQHLHDDLRILHNQTSHVGKFIRLELIGTKSNRSAIGALLDVTIDGRTSAVPHLAGCSYLSANEGVLTIGTGDASTATVTVNWPGGERESWELKCPEHAILIEGREGTRYSPHGD